MRGSFEALFHAPSSEPFRHMMKLAYSHDDRTRNEVIRIIHRRPLLQSVFFAIFWVVVLFGALMAVGEQAIIAIWDTNDYGQALSQGALFAVICLIAWCVLKSFGATCYVAFLPLDTSHPDAVDGVTRGNSIVSLTDDAVLWSYNQVHHEQHLSVFYKSWWKKGYLLLSSNFSEVTYLRADNPKAYLKAFRQSKKRLSKAGWALPFETTDVRHYDLPGNVYLADRARTANAKPPSEALWPYVFSIVAWLAALAIFAWIFFQEESRDVMDLITLALVAFVAKYFIHSAVSDGMIGWQRRRAGLTVGGTDLTGVTHGKTAVSIGKNGIAINRQFFRQKIRWDAISAVDVWDGWLVLRAEKHTLAIVPDSSLMRDAISKLNLQPLTGPWGGAYAAMTWTRAA